jgi:hypothetical protein
MADETKIIGKLAARESIISPANVKPMPIAKE